MKEEKGLAKERLKLIVFGFKGISRKSMKDKKGNNK